MGIYGDTESRYPLREWGWGIKEVQGLPPRARRYHSEAYRLRSVLWAADRRMVGSLGETIPLSMLMQSEKSRPLAILSAMQAGTPGQQAWRILRGRFELGEVPHGPKLEFEPV